MHARIFVPALIIAVWFHLQQLPAAHADFCSKCLENQETACKTTCAKAGSAAERCLKNCPKIKCADACAIREVAPPEPEQSDGGEAPQSSAACESCIKQMEQGQCQNSCRNRENPGACSKRCAKVRCARKCTLPGTTTEPSSSSFEVQPTEQTCRSCKQRQQLLCGQKCGNKERAGYTSCEVACVEEACLQSCKPGLF